MCLLDLRDRLLFQVEKEFALVSLSQLDSLAERSELVTVDVLVAAGMVTKGAMVKGLANGEVTRPVTVQVDRISAAAKSKIEAAGGKVVVKEENRQA